MKQQDFDVLLKFLETDCNNNSLILLSRLYDNAIPDAIKGYIKRNGNSILSVAEVPCGGHIDMINLIKSIQQKHKLDLWKELKVNEGEYK